VRKRERIKMNKFTTLNLNSTSTFIRMEITNTQELQAAKKAEKIFKSPLKKAERGIFRCSKTG
jgi:hypothetical protein